MILQHYTLNTGHTRQSPRSEVANEVVAAIRPMCKTGQYDLSKWVPSLRSWSVKVSTPQDCMMVTMWVGDIPVVGYGVAAGIASGTAERLWQGLERMYLDVTDKPGMRSLDFASPKMPTSTPWCAVVLCNEMAGQDWIGDFERCHAWAWIERQGDSNDAE